MAPSLSALRASLEDFFFERGSAQYRVVAGLKPQEPAALHAQLAQPETFHQIREVVERPNTDERERHLWARVLELSASQIEQRFSAEPQQAIRELESRGSLSLAAETLSCAEAFQELEREPQRVRREAIGSGLNAFFLAHSAPYARSLEASVAAARELGFPSYLALRERVTGQKIAQLSAGCAKLLEQTEDAYRDVAGYVLRKSDAQLRPLPQGGAAWHDLIHATSAPWMAAFFAAGDQVPATSRWLNDMGFAPNASGRIQLDLEPKSSLLQSAVATFLKVPDDIRLVLRARSGPRSLAQIMRELGLAQHAAHTARQLPTEERFLGDGAVPQAFGQLFENILTDEHWHRRYLRTPSSSAKEAARLCAFSELLRLRETCALLPYELSLYERGATAAAAEEFEERMTRALFAQSGRGLFLQRVQPRFASFTALLARCLETRLHSFLQNRFNEDYWRNPATGSWLKALFARGMRDDAAALALEWGSGPLELAGTAHRLIRVLGA